DAEARGQAGGTVGQREVVGVAGADLQRNRVTFVAGLRAGTINRRVTRVEIPGKGGGSAVVAIGGGYGHGVWAAAGGAGGGDAGDQAGAAVDGQVGRQAGGTISQGVAIAVAGIDGQRDAGALVAVLGAG